MCKIVYGNIEKDGGQKGKFAKWHYGNFVKRLGAKWSFYNALEKSCKRPYWPCDKNAWKKDD